jgi:2-dehydro-3-deoxy-D-gluconate 5-dehydrogenase
MIVMADAPDGQRDGPLAGRVALVTGAGRGVGRAIAQQLARLGADIGMIQRGEAVQTSRAVRELGRRAAVVQADLADPAAAEAAVSQAATRLGRIDVCVCNAGIIHREPALEAGLEQWARVVTVNLVSAFATARSAARLMAASDARGTIVFIASVLGFQGGMNVSSYAASKAGLVNLARALSNEWAPLGISVNAIAPGYLDNPQTAPLRADPARKAELDARIPAGRWGSDDDVAAAVAFLVTDASAYVTGHTLVVDGGWLGR